MPQSAERGALQNCISRLRHSVALAELAVDGAEPATAALYIIETLDDLSADIRLVRAALRRSSS